HVVEPRRSGAPVARVAHRRRRLRVDGCGHGARRAVAADAGTPRRDLVRAGDRVPAGHRRRPGLPAHHRRQRAFSSGGTTGVAWRWVGIVSAGAVFGGRAGMSAGSAIAFPRWFAPVVNGVGFDDFHATHWFSLASTTMLYALAGGVTGYMAG